MKSPAGTPFRARVAVVGAGLSGLVCATTLQARGLQVEVFEKARGAGGRMSTRRLVWPADDGAQMATQADLGCPAFSVHSERFAAAVVQAEQNGRLHRWHPRLDSGSYQPLDQPALWVPAPSSSAWCKDLASQITLHTRHHLAAIERTGDTWRLHFDPEHGVEGQADSFSHVVVAVPPAQAAPLVARHRDDWASQLRNTPFNPCWTLVGVARSMELDWELSLPTEGPLAWLARDDAKPGRTPMAGHTCWVAQATAAWSRTHLEASAAEVEALLQEAVARQLGCTPQWRVSSVHRWRYAQSPRQGASLASPYRLDVQRGLGLCGDYLAGSGVEGAWLSGHSLAQTILDNLAERAWS